MSRADLISKRTRNAFREVMVGWTLAEIRTEFDNEGFRPDYEFAPDVTGQRRTLIEQLYHPIDWSDHRNASRMLGVYQTGPGATEVAARGRDPWAQGALRFTSMTSVAELPF